MENEADLKQYTGILIKRWPVVVSIIVVAGLVASLISFLSPLVYQSKASAILVQTRIELVLEPQYLTVLETEGTAQREALVTLMKSTSVASDVIDELGEELAGETAESLLNKTSVIDNGDLIGIVYSSTNADQAADVANAWIDSYVKYVNNLYRQISVSLQELQTQVDASLAEYNEKQANLEEFIGDNSLNEISNKIRDKNLLIQIKDLRDEVVNNPTSDVAKVANNLAAILIQASAFTSLPDPLQLSTEDLQTMTISLDDIDDLISTVETRSGTTPGTSIVTLQSEILQLEEDYEQETSTQSELSEARDSAWNAYTVLKAKYDEVELATITQGALVRVADQATTSSIPVSPKRMLNIAIGLVLGLILGTLAAFAVEYFRKSNGETNN